MLKPAGRSFIFATVTGAVSKSLYALFVCGNADFHFSENLAASDIKSSFWFVSCAWVRKLANSDCKAN